MRFPILYIVMGVLLLSAAFVVMTSEDRKENAATNQESSVTAFDKRNQDYMKYVMEMDSASEVSRIEPSSGNE